MTETLFPVRRRCKSCGKGLGASPQHPVLLGLYCSPRCAKVAAPASRVADAPRECKTQRDGHWVFKRRYRSVSEIPDALRNDPSTNWYWCNHCQHLHVGHTRMGQAETLRMLDNVSVDLADLLVKLRGKASRSQIAAAAGVRPIRLKELEAGIGHAESLVVLGKVLSVYRARIGVALTPDFDRHTATSVATSGSSRTPRRNSPTPPSTQARNQRRP